MSDDGVSSIEYFDRAQNHENRSCSEALQISVPRSAKMKSMKSINITTIGVILRIGT